MPQPLWSPSRDAVARSRMEAFRIQVNQRCGLHLAGYDELHDWSIHERADFWQALADFFAVEFHTPAQQVLDEGPAMPDARWFRGATLNYAAHLLRRKDDQPALISISEAGVREQLSFAELNAHVAGLQRSLVAAGIMPGDRVAAILPNGWQAIVAMLATTSLGAVWSSCSPDFGAQGVIDRFGQIEPKVLIACSGYHYAGKSNDLTDRLTEVLRQLPTVEQLILVPGPAGAQGPHPDCLQAVQHWAEFYQPGGAPQFHAQPFDHPLYILYSSGTTGAPKCIVHRSGGVLLQHLKELGLHTDLQTSDRLFYYTTCGWMMWNWLASGLAVGATLVLYDGSPFHPHESRLIDLIDAEDINVFGVSARYLAALEKAGIQPARSHRLGSLRSILSTGSPLSPESFDYVYRDIKSDLRLSSISGGTDIVSCFALGNPLLPVWRGELQGPGLGMAVEVWNEAGQRVVGEKGELVCTRHFPSMPLGFWNDSDGSRYRAAYFERFPGIWAHGDYAERTEHGGLIIHGRSDAVLNPGGVRIGTAEIYRQVERIEEVLESVAIGQQWHDDVRVVLFVLLRDGLELDEGLQQRIRSAIRQHATPRHVPARILAVKDIPRTRSGKIVELAVRNVVHGQPVKNTEALANPEALEYFRNRVELEQ
ncbi:acetoacetate--CoA ligase [Halopseudomonas bauzanensis]|uniref:Acetoacetate--CoA ligase n=1 Tax=Halopseudomonas bauzanensis TaxID=653930 RepID=A0A4U0YLR6_9GAMM|nr:acetoacetate--CoA ligase [Halopseudomonas bauzanensis]TKA92245.1 acetoacetate--CoA ligase [Halopseudomonas bauzanensis]